MLLSSPSCAFPHIFVANPFLSPQTRAALPQLAPEAVLASAQQMLPAGLLQCWAGEAFLVADNIR